MKNLILVIIIFFGTMISNCYADELCKTEESKTQEGNYTVVKKVKSCKGSLNTCTTTTVFKYKGKEMKPGKGIFVSRDVICE